MRRRQLVWRVALGGIQNAACCEKGDHSHRGTSDERNDLACPGRNRRQYGWIEADVVSSVASRCCEAQNAIQDTGIIEVVSRWSLQQLPSRIQINTVVEDQRQQRGRHYDYWYAW